MDIQTYLRRGFDVEAVQITLENIDEVAQWCGATIEQRPVRMVNTTALLPTISLKGSGVDHANYYLGYLNFWVVKMNKKFRIYKPDQFDRTFVPKQQLTIQDVLKMIEDAGFELYGHILPAGAIPNHESTLSTRVNDAVNQALTIAHRELESHNTECEV